MVVGSEKRSWEIAKLHLLLEVLMAGQPRKIDGSPRRALVKAADHLDVPLSPVNSGPIAMVVSRFPRFSQTFIVNKFVGLLERGWNMHIVSPCSDPETPWSLFSSLPPPDEIVERIHIATDIESELLNLEPALVHFEFAELAIGRTYLKEVLDCNVVVSFRSPINYSLGLPRSRMPGSLFANERSNIAALWSNADALHLLSEHGLTQVRQYGYPGNKVQAIIRPAIDSDFFCPGTRTHTEQVGSVERPLRILSVGRLQKAKGHEYALEAVRLLKSLGTHCSYRIIGEGDQKSALETAVGQLDLGRDVELKGLGDRSDVKESMLWADVFLHPSITEPFGNAVLEAQSMGLPVVCTNVEGLPENIIDGQTGFLVPPADPFALASKTSQLSRGAALRQQMGQAGRCRIEAHFRLEDQITAFERLYSEILDVENINGPRSGAVTNLSDVAKVVLRKKRCQLLDAHRTIQRQRQANSENGNRAISAGRASTAIREAVNIALPRITNVLVVSKGDDSLLDLGGRGAWHFPQMEDGRYIGYHPRDSDAAIAHLEELRTKGGQYLLFPSHAFWWLEFYADFKRYLDDRYQQIWSDYGCIIYRLARQQPNRRALAETTAAGFDASRVAAS